MKKFVSKILILALMLMSMQAMAVVQVSASDDGIYTLSPIADASVGGAGWSGTTVLSTNTGNEPSVKYGSQYFASEDFFGCGGNVIYKQCPGYLAYFKFDLANTFDFDTQYIKKATIRLTYALSKKTDGAGGLGFWKVDDNTWTEDGITYTNAPLKTTQIGVSEGAGKILPDVKFASKNNMPATPTTYEYDITELLQKYNLSDENSVISFASILGLKYNFYANLETKESATESYRPTLTIETEEIQPIAVTEAPSGDVLYTSPLSVSYNNPLNPVMVNNYTVSLWCGNEKVELSDDDISVSGNTISVNAEKKPFKQYTLKIGGEITDKYGQVFGEETSYDFNTVTNTTTVTIGSGKFDSAMYEIDNPDGTGVASNNQGWLPFLYSGGTFREYYCVIDISDLAGKAIADVKYNLFCNGSINIALYKLDGDFVPGTTAYKDLPEAGEVFAKFVKAMGNSGGYAVIDITDYVRESLINGETTVKFMLKQQVPNQTNVANESAWSSWRPSLTAKTENETYIALKSSSPSDKSENVDFSTDIEAIVTADVSSVSAENITLANVTDGNEAILTDSEITYIPASRKIVINPASDLIPGKAYVLTIKNLTSGDAVLSDNIEIAFTTADDDIIVSKNGNAISANVCAGSNAGSYALIIAEYNGNKLVSFTAKKGTADSGIIKAAYNAADAVNNVIKVFLWETSGNVKPVTASVVID